MPIATTRIRPPRAFFALHFAIIAALQLVGSTLAKIIITYADDPDGATEQYRQAGMSDVQIKGLQRADAARTDSIIVYKFK